MRIELNNEIHIRNYSGFGAITATLARLITFEVSKSAKMSNLICRILLKVYMFLRITKMIFSIIIIRYQRNSAAAAASTSRLATMPSIPVPEPFPNVSPQSLSSTGPNAIVQLYFSQNVRNSIPSVPSIHTFFSPGSPSLLTLPSPGSLYTYMPDKKIPKFQ